MVFTIALYNTELAARGSILSIMEEKARNPQCAVAGLLVLLELLW